MALESAHPIAPDAPLWRGHCRAHPGDFFPTRADRLDAREDLATHVHRRGGHHLELLRDDAGDVGELRGYPAAGYARARAAEASAALETLLDSYRTSGSPRGGAR